MKRSRIIFNNFIALLTALTLLAGLTIAVTAAEDNRKVTISMIGKYDSADTAAIRSIDTEKKEIKLRNHNTGRNYTLTYDNTSMMYDARGVVLSASLLEPGQIVDVTFLKSTKHVTTLNVNKEAWTIENTRDHDLVRGDGTARIKGELYKTDIRTMVLADGAPALAEDILATDAITVTGLDKDVYSIIVTSGHGYVSLSSEVVENQSLVGSWIELDNAVIHRITPGMLLSAPEGDYTVQILGNGASFQSDVSISRNKETVVDTSGVTIEKPKEGLVTFNISPEGAEVYVDGEKKLTGVPVSIPYGYHSLKVMAEDYVTQNKYLKVGTASSVIDIDLEKEEDKTSSSESSSSASSTESATQTGAAASSSSTDAESSGSSEGSTKSSSSSAISGTSKSSNATAGAGIVSANRTIEGYKIYFDQPYDAEVYFDGTYVGLVPTSVPKVSGSHEVILKKDGCETKSYRIKVDTEEVSLNYTFPDLVRTDGYEESHHYYDDDDDDDDVEVIDHSKVEDIEVIEMDDEDDSETEEEDDSIVEEDDSTQEDTTVSDDDVEVIDWSKVKNKSSGN